MITSVYCPLSLVKLRFFLTLICFIVLLFIRVSFAQQNIQENSVLTTYENLLSATPFWKRSIIYQKIIEEKYIAISSRYDDKINGWVFTGGGQVKASLDKTWIAVLDFKRFEKLPEVFKEVLYDQSQKKLKLIIKILAIEKELVLRFKLDESKKDSKKMYFQFENGFLQELQGVLVLESSTSSTDVGLKAIYPHDVEKWPHWLFTLATEALMSRVASELRWMVEKGE